MHYIALFCYVYQKLLFKGVNLVGPGTHPRTLPNFWTRPVEYSHGSQEECLNPFTENPTVSGESRKCPQFSPFLATL